MIHFLGEVLAMGIAGFDPLGAIALLAALGMGARRDRVLLLMVEIIGTITVLTLAASFGLAQVIDPIGVFLAQLPRRVWAVLVAAVGAGILWWGVSRLAHRGTTDEEPAQESRWTSGRSVAVAGFAVGASCLVDPAWYGVVVLISTEHSATRSLLASLVWPVTSHVVMFPIGILALLGHGHIASKMARRLRESMGYLFADMVSVAMVLVGVLGLVEAIAEWNGHWLLPR